MDTIKLNDAQKRTRRARNTALGLLLAALVILFYVITIIKIGDF